MPSPSTIQIAGSEDLSEYEVSCSTIPDRIPPGAHVLVEPISRLPSSNDEMTGVFAFLLDDVIWVGHLSIEADALILSGSNRPDTRLAGMMLTKVKLLGRIKLTSQLTHDTSLSFLTIQHRTYLRLTRSDLSDRIDCDTMEIIALEEGTYKDPALMKAALTFLLKARQDRYVEELEAIGISELTDLCDDFESVVQELMDEAEQKAAFYDDLQLNSPSYYVDVKDTDLGSTQVQIGLLHGLGIHPEHALITRVPDDRMSPTFTKKSRVLVNTLSSRLPRKHTDTNPPMLLEVEGQHVIAYATSDGKTVTMNFTGPGSWPESKLFSEVTVVGQVAIQLPR